MTQESGAFRESIAAERRDQEHRWQRLHNEQQWQIEALRETLDHERQQRTQSEMGILTTIEDLHARMCSELALERRDREATESMILQLLEQSSISVPAHSPLRNAGGDGLA